MEQNFSTYYRVLPRDLFNEAKLLKCIGQLVLLIHDSKDGGMLSFNHESETKGFLILQNQGCGSLHVANLVFRTRTGERVWVESSCNNKSPYPLYYTIGNESGPVFEDDGRFSEEFKIRIGFYD